MPVHIIIKDMRSDITSKESTLQLVYDVLRLTPFDKAFLVTVDVPEIYMQEFWATVTLHHHSIRFKMDNKKRIVNLEYFRVMLHRCPRLPGQTFDELSFEEEILAFLRFLGHGGEIRKLTDATIVFGYLISNSLGNVPQEELQPRSEERPGEAFPGYNLHLTTYKRAKRLGKSGENDVDLMKRAQSIYRDEHKGVSFSQKDAWAILKFHPKWDAPEQVNLAGDIPGATQEDLFGHDARLRPAGKPRPAKKTKSDAMASTGGSSASTQFGKLMEQELRLKRKAAERAFEAQAKKDRILMRLEELRFLATSTKDLDDDDDAYWIKKQNRLIKNKMRNDLGDQDDEDE
nr:hypothetical protein [Tanacetum cinerariifolium]